ncbi:Cu(I)-responsive transcriptional regulator [Allosphingosinicella vermicomposti]|uniref:Cu(I)-responsive transcriptional regulator n=1 Tax=Allosphingosinicella vermicomposti TaxID=614671 RepID=UPI000D10A4A1|nr:Cu(I)-responsive transcriptional regulator [Allosphingosinicella vermicomposti]
MNIGRASERAKLPAKTIRFYEDIGLIQPARLSNGYRDYSERDVHDLRFIGRARSLGFTVDECRHLLELYRDRSRASSDVRQAAAAHINVIRTKIKELRSMEKTLASLIDQCAGDSRPDCPILAELAAGKSAS